MHERVVPRDNAHYTFSSFYNWKAGLQISKPNTVLFKLGLFILQADINCVVNQAELQSIMHTSLLRSVWPVLRILSSVKMFDEPNMIKLV